MADQGLMTVPQVQSPQIPDIGIPIIPVPNIDPQQAIGALQDVVTAKTKEYQAEADANQKNTDIYNQLQDTHTKLDADTLDAMNNISKISRYSLSGKANPITNMLGLFDSTWNSQYQAMRLKVNQEKAAQADEQAKARININNMAPALAKTQAEISSAQFDLQSKAIGIAKDIATLDNSTVENKIKVADLDLRMDQAQRDRIKFAVDAMDIPTLKANLAQANAGKGDWVPLKGYLENAINEHTKSDLAVKQLQTAVAKGNLDLIQEQQKNVAELIPLTMGQELLQKAFRNGDAQVTIPTPRGPINLPTNILAEAYDKMSKVQTAVEASALANQQDQTKTRLSALSTKAAALAGSDPRSAQEFVLINRIASSTNFGDPNALRNLNAAMTASETRLAEHEKTAVAAYGTPEAKAGAQEYFNTGDFSIHGANGVVGAVMGNQAVTSHTKFSGAWQAFNNALAAKIKEENPESPNLDTSHPSAAQTNSLLAWAMQKGSRVKVPELKDNLLNDTATQEIAKAQITNKRIQETIQKAIGDLSSGEKSIGTFAQINNREALRKVTTNAKGEYDPMALSMYLEQQSATEKNAVDYNQMLIDAVKARMSDTSWIEGDPEYSINDRALETKLLGPQGYRWILSDLVGNLTANKTQAAETVRQGIAADRAGRTQAAAGTNAAIQAISGGAGEVPGFVSVGAPTKKTLAEEITNATQNAPSAAVPGKTADYIRRLFGN